MAKKIRADNAYLQVAQDAWNDAQTKNYSREVMDILLYKLNIQRANNNLPLIIA